MPAEPRHTLVLRAEGTISQIVDMLVGASEQLDGLRPDESFGLDRAGTGFTMQLDVQPTAPEEDPTDG